MKSQITSAAWWRAALIRALRTALIVGTTYVPASYTEAVPWAVLGSAALMSAVFSLITSLAGLAEVDGKTQPWYFALLSRVTKTIAQALASGVLANVIFIQDVDWAAVLSTTITAGFGSLLLGVLRQLPEADDPKAAVTATVNVYNERGDVVERAVPAIAPFGTPPDKNASIS